MSHSLPKDSDGVANLFVRGQKVVEHNRRSTKECGVSLGFLHRVLEEARSIATSMDTAAFVAGFVAPLTSAQGKCR